MKSNIIRQKFLSFFQNKGHKIVESAPLVVKDDPSLMFTNAGMNQFKAVFLDNAPKPHERVANTQKCLRVSGKHNDLEEVGYDTYHHTMFEMLGNWSFGDYYKKEAIEWAWEFLVKEMKIPENRLYATVFEGDQKDSVNPDNEAFNTWRQFLPENRILYSEKKDNFWEMGTIGPCGPCSEIHVDLRNEDEKKKTDGSKLVNKGHPLVIEIWNLVFIQYNRKANGELELLPRKHVDTGMGFERLSMVLQNKNSAYDTDIFQPIIKKIESLTGKTYGDNDKTDVAFRVIADHIRAIAFSIADGQVPSNTGAGYVIKRILRRAVRYGYTFLCQNEPFIYKLVPVLEEIMGNVFKELPKQKELIIKVIREEEISFLQTLETGLKLLDQIIADTKKKNNTTITGKDVFKLYDTFGFPLDLTELILKEKGMAVDKPGFNKEMQAQKSRSKEATTIESSDWTIVNEGEKEHFTGYDQTETDTKIIRYRKTKAKGREYYELVLSATPFYAESGGQVGDEGCLEGDGEKIKIFDTKKENDLHIHLASKLPVDPNKTFKAIVNTKKRFLTANNHTATHLLHHALRKVLGNHVEQKGSLVHPEYLRFDFSHFQKMSEEEILKTEKLVNDMIRKNYPLEEERDIPINKAKEKGAIAFFGEKYGEKVRTVAYGDSVELCGGTHAKSTGQIGFFKIITEAAIASGIRRIEAVSGPGAEKLVARKFGQLEQICALLKNHDHPEKSIEQLQKENAKLRKELESFMAQKTKSLKDDLLNRSQDIKGIRVIAEKVKVDSPAMLKDIAFQLKKEADGLFCVLGTEVGGKANIAVMISDNLIKTNGLNANTIIREISKEIEGGGGGQPFFAMAGGKKPAGIDKALQKAITMVRA